MDTKNKEQEFQVIFHTKNPIQQKKAGQSLAKNIIKKLTNVVFIYPLSVFFWIASIGAITILITTFILFILGIQIESRESLAVAIIIGIGVYVFFKKWGIFE